MTLTLVQVLDAFVRLCVAQAAIDAVPGMGERKYQRFRASRACAAIDLHYLLRDGAVAC